MKRKFNTRTVILEILAKHPKGIAPLKLTKLVQAKYACANDTVPQALATLKRRGAVKQLASKTCECGKEITLYRLAA